VKIMLVNSGGPGFAARYAFDVNLALVKYLKHSVWQMSPFKLSSALINSVNPDLLLVMHGTFTPLSMVRYAKRRGTTTVLWLVEDPYEIDHHRGEMVNSYDYVFTNEKTAVSEYAKHNAYYLPWGCNPLVHKNMMVPEPYQSDLCFVGMGFRNRVRTLNAIAPALKSLNVKLIGDWHSWGETLQPDLQGCVIPTVNDFFEVQKYYNGAKINLNIHRDPVDPPYGNSANIGAVSPNDRVFALAGCGAFQLVDRTRPALWECFEDGREVVGFDSPDDLAQKVRYYLANPRERETIGKAAQMKAYAQHTFKDRLAEVFRIIHIHSSVRRHLKPGRPTRRLGQSGPVAASSFVGSGSAGSFYTTGNKGF
jgi:spore maturation protein CgeB